VQRNKLLQQEEKGMFLKSSQVIFISLWIFLACSTAKPDQEQPAINEQQPVAEKSVKQPVTKEQQAVAEKFITYLINSDHQAAYDLFTPKIIKTYPFSFFEMVMKKNYERVGQPMSYAYKSEAESVVNVTPDLEDASKSYLYTVVFEKDGKIQSLPLVLTFGRGASSNQLVTYKYLIDQMTSQDVKK
jgi:hypothetical protein